MRKVILASFFLSFLCLLLIAARPRPCRTRAECVNLMYTAATKIPPATESPAPMATQTNLRSQVNTCDPAYPNPYIAGTCAHATLESQLMMWEAMNCSSGSWHDGQLDCYATRIPLPTATTLPSAYP